MERSGFHQVTTIWLASVAVLVIGLLAFHWVAEREERLEAARSKASVVGSNAGAALVFRDEHAASELLKSLAQSPEIVEAALYGGDGAAMATFRARERGKPVLGERAPADGTEFAGRQLGVTMPAMLDGRRVGTVALRVSLDHLYAEMLHFVAGFGLIGTSVAILAYFATQGLRRRVEQYQDDLAASHAKLRQMVTHRENLLDAEHKRIAMEIHDELGQILTAALMNLRIARRGLGRPEVDMGRLIDDVQDQLDAAYRGMKDIATALHPAVLQFGFVPALEWLAERILKPAGLHWRIDAAPSLPPLDPRQAMALFRIVQESLTNVVRHAAAANVRVTLAAADGTLTLEVADDGRGIAPDAERALPKFGLIGMRERAESIGAHVTIDGVAGRGTHVRVILPPVGPQPPFVGKEPDET